MDVYFCKPLSSPAVELAVLRTSSLAAAVEREVERLILNGSFAPGERINENKLASELGTSRGPIREAIRAQGFRPHLFGSQPRLSVGVASQYAGVLGKKANSQSLVSLALAKDEVPIPAILRLFLPDTWITDPERLQHAGVPETLWVDHSKLGMGLEELQRVMQAGVSFGAAGGW